MEEEWRDVVGYEGLYQVSNLGRIKSFQYGNSHNIKIMNKHFVRGGYVSAQLWKSGTSKCIGIHRLVAQAFLENPNNFPLVGHKNNNKTDNRVENLYWTTYSENTQKAFDDKLIINDKGYEDSQSHPVIVYDINMNEIDRVGSISMCASNHFIIFIFKAKTKYFFVL